jgi:2-C-methyl-D-erythritol 4-phosphate cytidylyltransferase
MAGKEGTFTGNEMPATAVGRLDSAEPATKDGVWFSNGADMAVFSVVLVTAAPPGHAVEAGGAFVKIDGRESLLRASELFVNREGVGQIQIVIDADAMEEAKRRFAGHLGFAGVRMVSGGPRWADQIKAAAGKIDAQATHVVLHDAARPAVSHYDLERILEASQNHAAAALVAPVRASLVEVDPGGNAMAYHRSDEFMELLTPRVYTRDKFMEMAEGNGEVHASELTLVKGSPLNVRVAGPGDAPLLKTMIGLLPKPKKKGPTNPFEEAQW